MIELFINSTEEETVALLRKTFAGGPKKAVAEMRAVRQHFLYDSLSKNIVFEIDNVITSDGQLYESVEFVISSRYIKFGEDFIAGGGFCINYTSVENALHEAIDTWNRDAK